MERMLVVFLLLSSFAISGCEAAQEDPGASVVIEPTQYKKTQSAEFAAGKICVDSNMAAAPFVIRDRDQVIEITSVTYACFVLQVGQYSIEFQEVQSYSKTPPIVERIELVDGLRFDVTGVYAE